MKKIAVMAIAFLLFIPFASINGNNVSLTNDTNGNIFYVGGSGPNNYTSIQSAINDASNGYTICVYPGNYNESIVINKSISLIGIEQNGEKPVIDGGGRLYAVNISADGCIVKQFKIINYENQTRYIGKVTVLISSDGNLIENNTIDLDTMYMNTVTLLFHYASYNKIVNNTLTGTLGEILYIYFGSNNLIKGNSISSRTSEWIGIDIFKSHNNTITKNTITKVLHGISTWASNNTIISYNKVCHNTQYGMGIDASYNNTIIGNNISYNGCDGVYIIDSSYSGVYNNIIFHNGWDGIQLSSTSYVVKGMYNKIAHNTISENGLIGMHIWGWCKYNTIEENNIIGNKKYNAHFVIPDRSYNNTWDANYWGNWHIPLPKPIFGLSRIYPWLNFDKHPATQPYGNFTLENTVQPMNTLEKEGFVSTSSIRNLCVKP